MEMHDKELAIVRANDSNLNTKAPSFTFLTTQYVEFDQEALKALLINS